MNDEWSPIPNWPSLLQRNGTIVAGFQNLLDGEHCEYADRNCAEVARKLNAFDGLLAACETAHDAIVHAANQLGGREFIRWRKPLDEIKAAIAKAEGTDYEQMDPGREQQDAPMS